MKIKKGKTLRLLLTSAVLANVMSFSVWADTAETAAPSGETAGGVLAAAQLASGLITQEQYQAIIDAGKAKEKPPWDTALGGAIEIHGAQGGQTAGCIAMENSVMDILWRYCNLGVPVTIGP